jgi:ATP-dependent Lon protease
VVGIEAKVLAAKRGGLHEPILPFENEVNVHKDLKSEQVGDVKAMEEVVDLEPEGNNAAGRMAVVGMPFLLRAKRH